MAKKRKILREILSANIKIKREILDISQEKLAELADVSIHSIKGIDAIVKDDININTILLKNLKQNIQDDINTRFDRLQIHEKINLKKKSTTAKN